MPLTVSTDIQPALRSSESAPKNFGSRLMARREGLGLSVSDMADTTNIRPEYITAIEGLNEAALPAIGYTLGYVRTYAQALGMDGDIAVKDFKADAALSRLPMRDAPHVIFRRHWRLPRGFLSALTVASAALMIGVWYGTQSEAVATPVPMVEIAPQYTALAAIPSLSAMRAQSSFMTERPSSARSARWVSRSRVYLCQKQPSSPKLQRQIRCLWPRFLRRSNALIRAMKRRIRPL